MVLLAHHNCLRDLPNLRDTVIEQIKDIEAVTRIQLNVTLNRNTQDEIFFPRGFQKRETVGNTASTAKPKQLIADFIPDEGTTLETLIRIFKTRTRRDVLDYKNQLLQNLQTAVKQTLNGQSPIGPQQKIITEIYTTWKVANSDAESSFPEWIRQQALQSLDETLAAQDSSNDIEQIQIDDNLLDECLLQSLIQQINKALRITVRQLIIQPQNENTEDQLSPPTPLKLLLRKIATLNDSAQLQDMLHDLKYKNQPIDCATDNPIMHKFSMKKSGDKLTHRLEEKNTSSGKPTTSQEEDEEPTTTPTPWTPPPTMIPNEHQLDTHSAQTLSRVKRAFPLIPLIAVAAGANIIYSAVKGGAPFSFVGQATGRLFGLTRDGDFQKFKQRMESKINLYEDRFEVLRLNSDQFQTAINEIDQRLLQISEFVLSSHSGTVIAIMEQDLKSLIRHQLALQEMTLLRLTNILLAASSGKTSPYAITQEEMNTAAITVAKRSNIQLDSNLNNIKSYILIYNCTISIYLDVPIIDDQKLFTLYTIHPLPVYQDNKTLVPEIDLNYIGMSKSHSEYITLSEKEFTKCSLAPKECRISSPIIPMTKFSHCVISTYTSQKLQCPLAEKNISPRPEFIINGNRTIYSVPSATRLYIKCDNLADQHKYVDSNTVINGIGDITFRAGCTITTTEGTKWTTPSVHSLDYLPDNTQLFQKHKSYNVPTDVTIKFLTHSDLSQMSIREFTKQSSASFGDIAKSSFGFTSYMQFLLRTATIIVVLAIVLYLAYKIYGSCKRTFGPMACCPCIQPFPDDSSKLSRLEAKYLELEEKMQQSYQNFKNSTRNLATNKQVDSDTGFFKSSGRYLERPSGLFAERPTSSFYRPASLLSTQAQSTGPLTDSWLSFPTKSMPNLAEAEPLYPNLPTSSVRFQPSPGGQSYNYQPKSILKRTNSDTPIAVSTTDETNKAPRK